MRRGKKKLQRYPIKELVWSPDWDRAEEMWVEFVGPGPFDGMQLRLYIVREGPPGYIRVLEQGYMAPKVALADDLQESLTV